MDNGALGSGTVKGLCVCVWSSARGVEANVGEPLSGFRSSFVDPGRRPPALIRDGFRACVRVCLRIYPCECLQHNTVPSPCLSESLVSTAVRMKRESPLRSSNIGEGSQCLQWKRGQVLCGLSCRVVRLGRT